MEATSGDTGADAGAIRTPAPGITIARSGLDLAAEEILSVRGVSKFFHGPAGRRNLVLDNVSLSVHRGEFLSLVGPSGCGKTTLLRVIDGLIRQSGGEVRLEGSPVDARVRRRMGFVFQDANLLPWRSVLGNVELGLEAAAVPKKDRRDRAMEALRMVGLEAVADSPPYRLSGGMQQRVGVARALALRPTLLLMDEPFGHLDTFTRERLQYEMGQLVADLEATVVFVTHDIDEAILLSDRIVTMLPDPGRVAGVYLVPLHRPRASADVREDPTAIELRRSILSDLGVIGVPKARG
jgi:NitT/TauT family transport system ATP-binding protein